MTKDEYRAWKADPCTKIIFSILKERREEINTSLTDANLIMRKGSRDQLIKLIGERDGLDGVLELTFEDIEHNLKVLEDEISGDNIDVENRTSGSPSTD